MKIKDLVASLQAKDQEAEIQFIVCKTTGEIVCAKIDANAADIARLLTMFCPVERAGK